MSAHRDEIIEFTNDLVELHKYPDYGPMGCQFVGDLEWVDKIATAVSISKEVIEETHRIGAQMLIVHHGMFWNNESRILDERVGGRLERLADYGITVLGYHLALDANNMFGNNLLAAKALDLKKLKPFDIGWGGEYKEAIRSDEFTRNVQLAFGASRVQGFWNAERWRKGYPGPRGHEGDPKYLYSVKKCAVIVGGAYHYIVEAHRQGYDTFFTGEASEPAMHLAEDLGMNFVFAGHHNTEQLGVQALGKIIARKFGRVQHEYIPIANPV